MPTISVLPDDPTRPTHFRAVGGGKQFVGSTVGDAVGGLSAELGPPTETTLVVVQPMRPDRFFTADQQRRLADLMAAWRVARDAGTPFPVADQQELDALVRAEVEAATERARRLLRDSRS
jgi:hypothetical protein